MTSTITTRGLNRATLERQLLLRRSDLPVPDAVRHLAGLQAQTPHTWYTGLWSRLADYRPEPTGALLESGGLLRMALMRSTIHTVTADDALWLRPLVEPVIVRSTKGAFGRYWKDLDLNDVAAAAREHFAGGPLTFSELGKRLAEQWPESTPSALAQAVRAYVPLVQVPPRGVWGRSGPVAHTPVETWLGRAVDTDPPVAQLVLRYLAAFGPATVRDVQQWCGLTKLKEVVAGLPLTSFRDPEGRELFDLPDAPRPDPETPAPVRFLYDFDNLLLSHADRTRVVPDPAPYGVQGFGGGNMEQPCTLLLDGFAAGTWKVTAAKDKSTLCVRPFRKLVSAEEEGINAEGAGLLAFLTPDAQTYGIKIRP